MERPGGEALVLRETNEWLRYALFGGALVMGLLAAYNLAVSGDFMKIVGSLLGVVLFAFGTYVTEGRRIVVDPAKREVVVTMRGLREEGVVRVPFADIRRLLVVPSADRWALALGVEGRVVALTRDVYTTREQALLDAKAIQARLPVEVSESAQEANLAQSGRPPEAAAQARRPFGLTFEQAKEYVERLIATARNRQRS